MMKRLLRSRMLWSAAAGAASMYLADPRDGTRRRHVLRDRTSAFWRRGQRMIERMRRRTGSTAHGYRERARHLSEPPRQYDDVTLARKVEMELFRPPGVPKGSLDVNVQDGVVQLRARHRHRR